MEDPGARVIDLIIGRWRSRVLHAAVRLGVFDALAESPRNSVELAGELSADAVLLYRLLRALGSLGLLHQDDSGTFSLTPTGEMLRRDHPASLRGLSLLLESPEQYAAWKHLPELISEGKQDGFAREHGQAQFDYAVAHPEYGAIFNEAMTGFSNVETRMVLEALEPRDFSAAIKICDVGGGHGHTLCKLLIEHPHLQGTVLEMPSVIARRELLWADKLGVGDRCEYVAGNMFEEVPAADTYMLKRVLHDWNDEECRRILAALHRAAPEGARVLIMEHVVPGPDTPHFSKLFDIQMLVVLTGRERTLEEYSALLAATGWKSETTWYPASRMLGVVEGVKA